jgi:hypothetical protein
MQVVKFCCVLLQNKYVDCFESTGFSAFQKIESNMAIGVSSRWRENICIWLDFGQMHQLSLFRAVIFGTVRKLGPQT